MSHPRRHAVSVVAVGSIVLLITLSASILSGCGGTTHASVKATPTLPVPKDPAPVIVDAEKATTLDLGGGADLIIPPGAAPSGTTVRATYQGRPNGNWTNIAPTSAPVQLISNPPDAVHGLLTLEFPIPVDKVTAGIDPAVQFGISAYDLSANAWVPYDSTYDAARHMVVAQIPLGISSSTASSYGQRPLGFLYGAARRFIPQAANFTWWNPFTWDFSSLFANIAQGFGQLVGERAAPPKCSGGAPSWVGSLAGVLQDADVAIRSCAQSKGDILDIQIVNNRPYGQVLTYGSGVSWGWHESGSGVIEPQLIRLMDHFMGHNQLYLPPLGAASVGIFKPAAGSNTIFYIGPTVTTIAMDLAFFAAGKIDKVITPVVNHIIGFGGCAALYANVRLNGVSASALRDDLVSGFDCLAFGFTYLVSTGVITADMYGRFAATGAALRVAKVAGWAIIIGDAAWKIGDLIADWIVNGKSRLGNGFSVYAKSALPPPPTPTPVPHSPPTPTPVPQSQPVNAYSNYGSTTDGRAMCRGNPSNSASVPGGTVSQTFIVPSGVATLTSAKVQIDPDSTVTAHLSILVNGNVAATATAAAAGDTRFAFGSVHVSPGDKITVKISFTATYGKIITVYAVGHPGGTFAAVNTCSAGAPSFSTTSTGLRAVVSGMS